MREYTDVNSSDELECSEKELILLGLLAEEPGHPYILEQKIRARRMSEWTEISTSSVYRVLQSLEERALVNSRLVHEGQGATRKVAELTPTGRRALALGVLDQLTAVRPPHIAVQVGLAFVINAPYLDVVNRLEKRAELFANLQDEIAAIRAGLREDAPLPRDLGGATLEHRHALSIRLLFDHIEHHLRAERAFLGEALELLRTESPDHFVSPSVLAADLPARTLEITP